jgi:hypothetical protein
MNEETHLSLPDAQDSPLGDDHEVTPTFLADLAAQAGDLRTLIGNLCRLCSWTNREATSLRNEASTLTFIAGKYEAAQIAFRAEVLRLLDEAGTHKLVTDGYWVAVQESPPLVEIDPAVANPDAVDPRFVHVRRVWNQAAVLAAHHRGEPLPVGVSVRRIRYPKIIPSTPPDPAL